MNRKAQALPMNAMVLGALSLLVLIAVATMWVTGAGNIFSGFGQIIGGATPSTLTNARLVCQAACTDLSNAVPDYDALAGTESTFTKYQYCKKTFDLSEEGGATSAKCYDDGSAALPIDAVAIYGCVVNGNVVTVTNGCA